MNYQIGMPIKINCPFRSEQRTGIITRISESTVWIDEQPYSRKTGKEINASKYPYQKNWIAIGDNQ